ncbi:glutathione synthase [Pseudomarimonas salicorniae]|uniref:Glutathione synthetase n=1 Tax=Pseudomarimonas salicorniae TaxID=2933270 RepID=A0ABT0GJ31_9GAMM|nr:glutathione synthase [Lysobacter sp. CAU 1642]MCK7594362.1 glutathione synthase [Lysobacter sp. CAU 1642]
MALNIAVVMDPIESVKIAKDSTFAMLLEAQRRGHRLLYVRPGSLGLDQGTPTAELAGLAVADEAGSHFRRDEYRRQPLSEADVVLMRRDPPVDASYLHETQILSQAQTLGVRVLNDPTGLRDMNEKLFALHFPALCPRTLVSRDAVALRAFVAEHGECVLKPLDGMGGRSIFRVRRGDPNLNVILETLAQGGSELVMAQQFLPAISEGDKRVLLVDGEPAPYCLARIPQGEDFRGNLAVGGRGEARPISDADRAIAEAVGPTLRARGMVFVGLDVIGDRLTEVNVTSPTCIREIAAQTGFNVATMLFDHIEAATG